MLLLQKNLMKQGICELPYIPLRSEPRHQSEMLSQILFGEIVEIVEDQDKWLKVRILHDNYLGFIEQKSISEYKEKTKGEFVEYFVIDNVTEVTKNNDSIFYIPAGSRIPINAQTSRKFSINKNKYKLSKFKIAENTNQRSYLVEKARQMLNSPYLWGGCTPWGIDCSGFTQLLYKLIGINIPRDADLQATSGNLICFLEDAQPGDLAFFANEDGQIVHVGMIGNDKTIFHASTSVRKDNIDYFGIFNLDIQRYTHQLNIIKSLL
jgi:cell wall-associated NlpC family hydrolase